MYVTGVQNLLAGLLDTASSALIYTWSANCIILWDRVPCLSVGCIWRKINYISCYRSILQYAIRELATQKAWHRVSWFLSTTATTVHDKYLNLWTPEISSNNTHHHHEYRNPGGSPNVIFFSHRIYNINATAASFTTKSADSWIIHWYILYHTYRHSKPLHFSQESHTEQNCKWFSHNLIKQTSEILHQQYESGPYNNARCNKCNRDSLSREETMYTIRK